MIIINQRNLHSQMDPTSPIFYCMLKEILHLSIRPSKLLILYKFLKISIMSNHIYKIT